MSASNGSEPEVDPAAPAPVDAFGGPRRRQAAKTLRLLGALFAKPGLLGYSLIALLVTAYVDIHYVSGYGPVVTPEVLLAEATGYLALFNAYAAVQSAHTGDKIAAAIDMIAKGRNSPSASQPSSLPPPDRGDCEEPTRPSAPAEDDSASTTTDGR